MLIIEIDHSNPYYDDSYAVNSANIDPYGDAIMRELVPAVVDKILKRMETASPKGADLKSWRY